MPAQTLSLLLLMALGQGLFLVAVLLAPRPGAARPLPLRRLAALVGVFVLLIGHAWLDLNQMFGRYPRLAPAVAPLPLLVGPLLWSALQSLRDGRPPTWRDAWHGLPFGLALGLWLPVWLQPPELATRQTLPPALRAFGAFKAAHLALYLLASLRLINRARQAQPDEPLWRRLFRLTGALGVGLGLAAGLFAAEGLGWRPALSSDLAAAITLTAFVYALAFGVMRLPLTAGGRAAAPASVPPAPAPPPAPPLLAPDEAAAAEQRLRVCLVQDQVFRDGELGLEQLAARLALTPHELSQLINQRFGVNFQELLNGYRVDALKTALADPLQRDQTVLALALAAGFNSKSSLNRVFKGLTGQTPTQFRQAAQAGRPE